MDYSEIISSMRELDEDRLYELLNQAKNENEDGQKLLEALQKGMEEVGNLFEEEEYFIGDLVFAGDVMANAMEIIKPLLTSDIDNGSSGRMIICTVEKDNHDIGKNIVKSMLEAAGLQVTDLGTDVRAEDIVRKVQEEDIHIVALSAVLTLAVESMKKTIEEFEKAGIRDSVRIIVGGLPVNEEIGQYVKADEWAKSPSKTVEVCCRWAKEV